MYRIIYNTLNGSIFSYSSVSDNTWVKKKIEDRRR